MMMLCAGAAADTGNTGNDPAPTRAECISAASSSYAVEDEDCRIHGSATVDSDSNCVMRLWCPAARDPVTKRVTQYDIVDWTGSVEDAANLDWDPDDRELAVHVESE